MKPLSMRDFLPFVERPSRYIGNEINRITKFHNSVDLKFVLAFPDMYDIGMSHFGIQILYHIINSQSDMLAERVFAPGPDMEQRLRASRSPLVSLETQTPLNQFDIIGFSLLSELNYTNVLTILDLAGLEFRAADRDGNSPLVIAGGPCTCNPEPVAEIFDAMVIGEAEYLIMDMARAWKDWKASGNGDKTDLLRAWSKMRGVYIPSFFTTTTWQVSPQVSYEIPQPLNPEYSKVQRAIVPDLDSAPFPDAPLIAYGKPVHDRLRLEIARGCSRGCRFCQAGMIYRPVRERSLETVLELNQNGLANTGYEDVSLLSLSTGDYSAIARLLECLMNQCQDHHVAVSLPSLRADTLTSRMMELIKSVRKTGFTIAPEAASQRLRDVINKNITQEDIIHTVENAFKMGWQIIKLYFMVGLPTETQQDLEAMVDLAKELRTIRPPKGRQGKITISAATFIPKPHTPFQWASQLSLAEAREKGEFLKDRLRMPRIQFKWQNPELSVIEGLLSRGDRNLFQLLLTAYAKGCRFDGWTDQFRFDTWVQALAEQAIDWEAMLTHERPLNMPLPWDHIDVGVSKSFLTREWEHAHTAISTPDCRHGDCHGCGVCDFSRIEPKVHGNETIPVNQQMAMSPGTEAKTVPQKLILIYKKEGNARFFGHLELVNIFVRAIRRANIPIAYSQGFHPMPKISFDDPLPIGMESQEEICRITVTRPMNLQSLMQRLNSHLPKGLAIVQCLSHVPFDKSDPLMTSYRITAPGSEYFQKTSMDTFMTASQYLVTKKNAKGKIRQINLRPLVHHMELVQPDLLLVSLVSSNTGTVRPTLLLSQIFGLTDDQIATCRILKVHTRKMVHGNGVTKEFVTSDRN